MIVNSNPQMGYSELVEMYGEALGFSIGKTLRKTKNAVKSAAKTTGRVAVKSGKFVARNPATIATGGALLLAPKSIQKKVNSGTRIAATSGLSLALSKQDRNLVGSAARATQSKILRPVTHAVIRSPVLQKAAVSAARTFIPGASAALDTASAVQSLARKKVSSLRALVPKDKALPPAIRSAFGQVGQARPPRGSAASLPAAAEAPAAAHSFPILPLALGGAGLLLVGVLAMGKKK